MGKWIRIATAVFALALVVPMGQVAFGGPTEEEQHRTTAKGLCTGGTTTWDMEMALEVGVGIEVGVDSGIPDQEWHLVVRYNQHVLIDQIEMTEDEGDFDIRFVENNAVGKDAVQIRARNAETGELCVGEMESTVGD
jgi:hypothetical protein